jgi:hypothetical protein
MVVFVIWTSPIGGQQDQRQKSTSSVTSPNVTSTFALQSSGATEFNRLAGITPSNDWQQVGYILLAFTNLASEEMRHTRFVSSYCDTGFGRNRHNSHCIGSTSFCNATMKKVAPERVSWQHYTTRRVNASILASDDSWCRDIISTICLESERLHNKPTLRQLTSEFVPDKFSGCNLPNSEIW